ncbi:MAG: transposase [Bryobacteraceae bacterium]
MRKRSPDRFASWVGVCPRMKHGQAGSQESTGVCYSHRSAKGNRYLRRLLCQIGWAAIHTKESFLQVCLAGYSIESKVKVPPGP